MIDIRYFLILTAWILLMVGFYYRNFVITIMGGIFLIILGIHLYMYGLLNVSAFLINTLALVQVTVGSYVFMRGTWEQFKDY